MKCLALGCDRPSVAHGQCKLHYYRWRRTGGVALPPPDRTIIDPISRLMGQVTTLPETGCLIYLGGWDRDSYGIFTVRRKSYRAHRWLWEQTYGPIPAGKWLLHHCDTPPCINVWGCLYIGTARENSADMCARNRQSHRGGNHQGNPKITRVQADEIRTLRHIDSRLLAAQYGLSRSAIYDIWSGKTWG
jgi:HNH endonuclease